MTEILPLRLRLCHMMAALSFLLSTPVLINLQSHRELNNELTYTWKDSELYSDLIDTQFILLTIIVETRSSELMSVLCSFFSCFYKELLSELNQVLTYRTHHYRQLGLSTLYSLHNKILSSTLHQLYLLFWFNNTDAQ